MPISPITPVSAAGPDPLYLQVHRAVADEIARGTWRPEERLPPERVLCERFAVSRVTLRRALNALVSDGLLRASHGRGWYVAGGPLGEPPNALESFSAMGRARGLVPSARVLSTAVRPATIDEAEALTIAPGADLFAIERLRLLDGLPISIDKSRVPLARAPGLAAADFSQASLYTTLEADGVVPAWAEFALSAAAATPEEAALLDLAVGSPLLTASQTTFDQDHRPIELGHVRYRGDRYRFRATLVRRR